MLDRAGGHEVSPYHIYLMFKKNHTIQLKKSACDETSEMSPGVQSAVDGVASDGSDEIGWLICLLVGPDEDEGEGAPSSSGGKEEERRRETDSIRG